MRRMTEPMQRPPRLRAGSRVALIAPAGPIDGDRLESALAMCRMLSLEPVIGEAATARDGFLAGPDAARAADFQRAIDDTSIDAVWALRGGYGTVRLLPHLQLDALHTRPKAYIGFSDNTSIHLALAHKGVVSFHAPHAGGDFPPFSEAWFRRMLFDANESVVLDTPLAAPLEAWTHGTGEGRLIGGNLALLAAAEGTPYAMPSDGAIVFIEDVGEAPYRVDRLLMQLLLSGALQNIAGLIIGQFTDCDDETCSVRDVLHAQLTKLGVPIIANAPIGHVADNWTVPVGARARIEAVNGRTVVTILEPVVS